MNTHLIILIVHIVCGFTALTVGIIPMAAKKGGKLHMKAGIIYARGMYGVSATAIGLFLLNPGKPFLQFLLCISLLSFYFTFTGVRAIALHRQGIRSHIADRVVAWLTLGASVCMFFYGAYAVVTAINQHTDAFLGILYMVFGPALGSAALADVKAFSSNTPPQKMSWLFSHFIRMLSAYIATFTAFCVVNVHFLPPLLVWTLPGVIGAIMISQLVKKYKKKFSGQQSAELTMAGIENGQVG